MKSASQKLIEFYLTKGVINLENAKPPINEREIMDFMGPALASLNSAAKDPNKSEAAIVLAKGTHDEKPFQVQLVFTKVKEKFVV